MQTLELSKSTCEVQRPLLKWAGGKTQLLPELLTASPAKFNNYVEPFLGGAALFFRLRPGSAVISDSNAELINFYRCVADEPERVVASLGQLEHSESAFYELRAKEWTALEPVDAAARMLFLNRTCFNGLYRVNKKGEFNVPFGRHVRLSLPSSDAIVSASAILKQVEIVHGDYLDILRSRSQSGDFVYLDPPYIPVGKYSDFKRYTKEQFTNEDHRRLADEVHRLVEMGCFVLVNNSNHPLVHDLYADFKIDVVQTRRFINSNGAGRTGEDVLITCSPDRQ
jgi:DNA adenine methylase